MRISDWSSDVCSSDLQRRKDACERTCPSTILRMVPLPVPGRILGIIRRAPCPPRAPRLGAAGHRATLPSIGDMPTPDPLIPPSSPPPATPPTLPTATPHRPPPPPFAAPSHFPRPQLP